MSLCSTDAGWFPWSRPFGSEGSVLSHFLPSPYLTRFLVELTRFDLLDDSLAFDLALELFEYPLEIRISRQKSHLPHQAASMTNILAPQCLHLVSLRTYPSTRKQRRQRILTFSSSLLGCGCCFLSFFSIAYDYTAVLPGRQGKMGGWLKGPRGPFLRGLVPGRDAGRGFCGWLACGAGRCAGGRIGARGRLVI